jgi:hypothetical protein
MAFQLLTSSKMSGCSFDSVGGLRLVLVRGLIAQSLDSALGRGASKLLAEPVEKSPEDILEWHTEAAGPVLPFGKLSADEQSRVRADLSEKASLLRAEAGRLKKSSSRQRHTAGEILNKIAEDIFAFGEGAPSALSVFLVGGSPVIAGWGLSPARHNALLGAVEGVDGLKTGYIDEAGYNIALTAERKETRLVAVILGAPVYGGDRIRDADGSRLLEWGFNHFKTLWPPQPEIPDARIWKGALNRAAAVPAETLPFTTFADRGQGLRWEVVMDYPLIAPFPQGGRLGTLVLHDQEGELRRIPLIAKEDIEGGNIFKRAWDSTILFFRRLFRLRR